MRISYSYESFLILYENFLFLRKEWINSSGSHLKDLWCCWWSLLLLAKLRSKDALFKSCFLVIVEVELEFKAALKDFCNSEEADGGGGAAGPIVLIINGWWCCWFWVCITGDEDPELLQKGEQERSFKVRKLWLQLLWLLELGEFLKYSSRLLVLLDFLMISKGLRNCFSSCSSWSWGVMLR